MKAIACSMMGVLLASCGVAGEALASRVVVAGLQRPMICISPAGDARRLFIVEQYTGKIRILDLAANVLLPDPFITVDNLLIKDNEQGFLGLAFHPKFATNGLFYVYCTAPKGTPGGQVEIRRYKVDGDAIKKDTADPASKQVLLTFDKPEANHNGGWLDFGPDGYLYLGTGDGGGGDDRHGPIGNGQKLDTLLGKILRIDVNGGAPYAIPDGNPFKGDAAKRQEIWAFGIRNAWRCGFDRLTGDLWIGDIGQNKHEEIDVIPKGVGGLNFGWRPREGVTQNPAFPNEKPVTAVVDPVFDYTHERGNCVIGGYVYRGKAIPGLQGTYFFADNGSSRIWSLTYDGKRVANEIERTAELNPGNGANRPIGNITSFGEDAAGEIYICDMPHGAVHKIVLASSLPKLPAKPDPSVAANSPKVNKPGGNYGLEPLRPAGPYLKMPMTPERGLPALLSQTGAFEDVAKVTINSALVPYTVNVPFWSDGGQKTRWMSLPAGETIGYAPTGDWTFPAGTVFVKHFELNIDERNPATRRRLETRLLVAGQGGQGYGVTYKWKADGTDAELLADNLTEEISIATAAGGTRTQKWTYPSRTDCLVCHTVNAGFVLGVKTRQLNGNYTYPARQANQLRTWNHLGLFKPALDEDSVAGLDRLTNMRDAGADIELRVRSYLDVNCAYCHRPGGAQGNLDARFDNLLGFRNLIGGSVNINLEIPGAKIVAPGDPAHSTTLSRMLLAGKNQMPPVGRNEIDREGCKLLETWIKSLPAK